MPCTVGRKKKKRETNFWGIYCLMLSKVSSVEKICKPIHIDTAVNLIYQCSVNAHCITTFEKLIFLVWYIHNSAATTAKLCVCFKSCPPIYIHILIFCCFLHNVFIILTIFHFWVLPPTLRIERFTPTWTLEWHAENVGQICVHCKECGQWEPQDGWMD